jgi:NAD(P)-dependent dehydrogenase (short-subunit alcohol dehydrogenase family)
MGKLAGKIAAITGAGSGIGAATAAVFAREGAKLVLCDTRRDYLDQLASSLDGGPHQTIIGDISLEATAVAVARAADQYFGALDVLVANVGLMFFKDITEVTVEEFDRLMAVNVRGMVLACKHALPLMLRGKAGSIVIVSSGSAFRGQEFDGVSTFAYNMTKAAVRQLAISLATRYAADGRLTRSRPALREPISCDISCPPCPPSRKRRCSRAPQRRRRRWGAMARPTKLPAQSSSWLVTTRLSSPVRRWPSTAASWRGDRKKETAERCEG